MKSSIALNIKRVLRVKYSLLYPVGVILVSWQQNSLSFSLSIPTLHWLWRSPTSCPPCRNCQPTSSFLERTTGNFLKRKRNLYVETQIKCQEIFRIEGRERPGPSSRPLLVLLTYVLETALDAGVLALPDIWNVVRDCCMIRTIHLHSLDFSINWRYLIQFPNYFFISSRLN